MPARTFAFDGFGPLGKRPWHEAAEDVSLVRRRSSLGGDPAPNTARATWHRVAEAELLPLRAADVRGMATSREH
ncbi:hypothetical protein GCM10020000_04960 [Streptomyces olivoverticillatus]